MFLDKSHAMKTRSEKLTNFLRATWQISMQAPVSYKFIGYEEKDVARLLYFIQFNMFLHNVLCRSDSIINLKIWKLHTISVKAMPTFTTGVIL